MKTARLLTYGIISLFASAGPLSARPVIPLTPQELNEKSDLVVIATATSNGNTNEKITNFKGIVGETMIGIETKFTVLSILKGDTAIRNVVLHHYKADGIDLPDGPGHCYFDPSNNRKYILFLVREADGRYAPTSGQMDPQLFCLYQL